MKIFRTTDPPPKGETERLYVYNGLDCCITHEVFPQIERQFDNTTRATYEFSKDLMGPVLEMNLRGILVDQDRRGQLIHSFRKENEAIAANLDRLIREGIGTEFKYSKQPWPSPAQLGTLFYDIMGLPEIRKRTPTGMVRTTDRDALEKLSLHFFAEPIVNHILALRDRAKKISFLSTEIDNDGRLRTSFNIAGTNTGRFSSSFSEFGVGTNVQNIENRLRSVLIADPGYKFCSIDLEQSDARAVGAIHYNLFSDSLYLDRCESGDLHTSVARDCWRDLRWTNLPMADRALADEKFYREFSYRDAAKRLGHGTNYEGQPDRMSMATKIAKDDIKKFQVQYLLTFPTFPRWWAWVEEQVRTVRYITTMLGRKRYFLGHPNDGETKRSAIAFEPQSVTADTINRGLLRIWQQIPEVHLLNQVHDSILFQFPEHLEDQIVPQAKALIEQTLILRNDRPFVIPAEPKVGWNWSDYHPHNNRDPDALRKYVDDKRPRRRERKPGTSLLDRRLLDIH